MPDDIIKDKKGRIADHARRLKKKLIRSMGPVERAIAEKLCELKAASRVAQEEARFKTIKAAFLKRSLSAHVVNMFLDRLLRFPFSQKGLQITMEKISTWPDFMTEDEVEIALNENVSFGDEYWNRLSKDERKKVIKAYEPSQNALERQLRFCEKNLLHPTNGEVKRRASSQKVNHFDQNLLPIHEALCQRLNEDLVSILMRPLFSKMFSRVLCEKIANDLKKWPLVIAQDLGIIIFYYTVKSALPRKDRWALDESLTAKQRKNISNLVRQDKVKAREELQRSDIDSTTRNNLSEHLNWLRSPIFTEDLAGISLIDVSQRVV